MLNTSEGARRLLIAPFDEAAFKGNLLNNHMLRVFQDFVAQDSVFTNTHKHRLAVGYLNALDSALQQRRVPQHGTIPGQSSVTEMKNILDSLDVGRAFREVPVDGSACDLLTPESLGTLREALGRVLAQVVNLPLLPREAAQLLQCWCGMGFLAGSQVFNITHPALDVSFQLVNSLLWGPATAGNESFVADHTPALPVEAASWEQSCMEFLEAVYEAGAFCGSHARAWCIKYNLFLENK